MLSPMCQYCVEDGFATDWQHVHLGTRAVGGAGIVMTEATAVDPSGRITPYDVGIWSNEHAERLARTASFIKEQGATPGIQLSHAGRKASHEPPRNDRHSIPASEGGWETLSPSGIPYPEADPVATRKMNQEDISRTIEAFKRSASRADSAGFEIVELHAAHGYLLHQFLSPVANDRDDEYGGCFANRVRFLEEVIGEVQDVWPEEKPLFVRVSATDWLPERDSWTLDDAVRLAKRLSKLDVDLVDVSAGGVHPDQQIPEPGPGYQVPYSEEVRAQTGCRTATVGKITSVTHADAIIRNDRADIVVLGRELLRDPYWPMQAARELEETVEWPTQYVRAKL